MLKLNLNFLKSIKTPKLSHVDSTGKVNMVDITTKNFQTRKATAECKIILSEQAYNEVYMNKNTKKGDIITVAKIAGINAAKNTSNIIPLCHSINLTHIEIDVLFPNSISCQTKTELLIRSTCTAKYATGVEMEALMASNVTALTIYDMIKAVDSKCVINDLKLINKTKQ